MLSFFLVSPLKRFSIPQSFQLYTYYCYNRLMDERRFKTSVTHLTNANVNVNVKVELYYIYVGYNNSITLSVCLSLGYQRLIDGTA